MLTKVNINDCTSSFMNTVSGFAKMESVRKKKIEFALQEDQKANEF